MSFTIAVRGLNAVSAQLNTISNNIANADTVGYKSGRENFSALYVDGVGNGVLDQGAQQSLGTNGSVVNGSSSLDLAISGKGFFVLQDTNGSQKFSRAGYVQVDKDGYLVNNNGLKYEGYAAGSTGGAVSPLLIPQTQNNGTLSGVNLDEKGNVQATYTNGETVPSGQVVLASFANMDQLQSEDGTVWRATQSSGAPQFGIAQTGVFGSLHNGSLESSNVDLTSELVNLMSAQRNYQANTKVISTDSSMFTALFQAI
ncbi:flagellar hook basal-body protein [Tatumella sp. TA1]|uniref:flagellar hook-basal body complex protein n=1 Tax=Rosenbergiella collisarenosi TaxID=1544695 RepID=UPI0008F80791|nr:flagellar hook basal-body protein [Rosenbergiella collisarenosi]MBT0721889.1 flagellar hook basal-body protein [Rosenbergiella collisarenosi]QGX92712.1 flagellar hook basal-body protein [Tatumella sp. TA1]